MEKNDLRLLLSIEDRVLAEDIQSLLEESQAIAFILPFSPSVVNSVHFTELNSTTLSFVHDGKAVTNILNTISFKIFFFIVFIFKRIDK